MQTDCNVTSKELKWRTAPAKRWYDDKICRRHSTISLSLTTLTCVSNESVLQKKQLNKK